MRSARLVILASVFTVLLLWAVVASAECAWILWSLKDGDYMPMLPFDARRPCIDNIVSLAKSAEEKGNLLSLAAGMVRYKTEDGSETMVNCFPDTIDPRGPKGGGR